LIGACVVNINPRRKVPAPKAKANDPAPWNKGDPSRKLGLNTPIPEPLMLMLDYLIENKVISSKASFIRDVVSKAAEAEITRFRRVREAVKRIEAEDRRK
jgi:hypothetical protein